MPRPNVTPRPVCRYYNTPRGCFTGNKCHYRHGDPVKQKYAPYEENKTCRFYAQGYCKRGFECWFRHVDPEAGNQQADGEIYDPDLSCGICFEEKPALYGLLSDCSHGFCIKCIRQWRDPQGKGADMADSGVHKTCPMCRAKAKFIVPSSIFYKQNDPRKVHIIKKYKESMGRVSCRYFAKSSPADRFCPFGRDCFYRHWNDDGTPYVFQDGVDVMIRRLRHRNRQQGERGASSSTAIADPLQAVLEVLERFSDSLAVEESRNGPEDTESRRTVIATHVREMMRIMGHAPALETLDALERMAGEDPEEVEETPPLEPVVTPIEEAGESPSSTRT